VFLFCGALARMDAWRRPTEKDARAVRLHSQMYYEEVDLVRALFEARWLVTGVNQVVLYNNTSGAQDTTGATGRHDETLEFFADHIGFGLHAALFVGLHEQGVGLFVGFEFYGTL